MPSASVTAQPSGDVRPTPRSAAKPAAACHRGLLCCIWLLCRSSKRPCYRLRLCGGHPQKSECRSLRCPTALLPVAQCGDAHANHERKLTLRLAELASDCLHVSRSEREGARRLCPAPANAPGLPDAPY